MEFDLPVERIDWLIQEYYDGKPKRWTDAMGVAPSTYTSIKKGQVPSLKLIISIKTAHPNISLDWLVMNVGPRNVTSDQKLIEKNTKLRKAVSELMNIIRET